MRYHTFANFPTFAHAGRIRMHRWSWWNIWKTSRDDRDLTEIFFSQKGRGKCVFCAEKVAKGSHWFGKKAGAERIGRVSWISLELKPLKWSANFLERILVFQALERLISGDVYPEIVSLGSFQPQVFSFCWTDLVWSNGFNTTSLRLLGTLANQRRNMKFDNLSSSNKGWKRTLED